MIIPVSIQLFFNPTQKNSSFLLKAPSFDENPAIFYASFISTMYAPILQKEDELLILYDQTKDHNEANKVLEQMELEVNTLPILPKYEDSGLQPLYESFQQVKEAFKGLVHASLIKEAMVHPLFNAEDLRPYYEDYLVQKENLYQMTIKTFQDLNIVFFLEDDGTITVYNP